MSKVFDFTPDYYEIHCDNVIKGGTGYDIHNKLPDKIDNAYPDYSLYGITGTAYGYLTRGCPRNCKFCVVPEKEGLKSKQYYELGQFWKDQKKIVLLDPNITAAQNCVELFNQLARTKAEVDFTQGLDLRLLNKDKVDALNKIKTRDIHFAWDNINDEKIILKNLKIYIKSSAKRPCSITVYMLVNYNTSFEEDLHRIYKLKELGVYPYVMIYNKTFADNKYFCLQNWVNYKPAFAKIDTFEKFMIHTKNRKRSVC
jgi:pyruvate-formate lyase-activating enzyme